MAYTTNKKPGGLTQVSTLGDNDNLVVDQSGEVKRATVAQMEAKIFDGKTVKTVVDGSEVVVVRQSDDSLRQVSLSNIVPSANITNDKVAPISSPSYLGITDNKLATISTAGKVANSATTATSANTASAIVARDGSGNFSAGTITATLSGNASSASTVADSAVTSAKLATDAVVTSKIANDAVTADKLDGVQSINQQTGNYTLVLSDAGRVIEVNSGSNLTVTIPANSSVAFATGATIVVTRRGTGEVTIAGAGGVTLRSADSWLRIGRQFAAAACIKIGTDEWLVVGNLKS